MTTTDDLEIVIDDKDLPADFETAVVEAKKDDTPAAEAKVEDKPVERAEDDPIASLKRQLDDAKAEAAREREARATADRDRHEAETKAHKATGDTLASHIASVESAIALSKADAEKAEQQYAAAMEVADYTAAAKAQRTMARAESQIRDLENGKAELQHRHKIAQQQPPQRREAPSGVDGMVNDVIAASSPKAQAYISRNRASLTDVKHVNKMIAAHQMAISDDIEPDTEAYFAFIDERMGWGARTEDTRPAPRAEAKSHSAPVSRDTAKASGDLSGKQVRLTREEVALATELGITPTAYARNKLKIASNGKDPSADGLRFSNDIRN